MWQDKLAVDANQFVSAARRLSAVVNKCIVTHLAKMLEDEDIMLQEYLGEQLQL